MDSQIGYPGFESSYIPFSLQSRLIKVIVSVNKGQYSVAEKYPGAFINL